MTDLKKNVPELRFPGFSGEWEEKKLSDLGSYSKSYSFSRDVEGVGKVHHIHYGDIHSKLPSKISDINLLPTIKESKDFEFLQKGDIIFADASEDYKDLGKAIMVDIDEDNIIAGLHTHVFRPNLQVVSEFLIYYTKTLNYFKFIKRQGTGISVLGISKKNLSNFILGLPEYKEQQKIGDFFSKLDRQIELEEQKLALLEEQKKGYMQKIFSQELRFKDDNGNDYPEWINKKLGDIGHVAMNKRIYKTETSSDNEIPFYKIGTFGKEADSFITREKFEEYKKKYPYPKKGDILISASGSIGKTIEYDGEEAYYQDSNIVWLEHNHEVLNIFLKHFYSIIKWSSEGTTIKRLYNKDILNTRINLPVIEEQEKMGLFLTRIDQLIEKQTQKINLLKQRKQGFLQKMFI
ncbi:restriction endonuclease subunit S [Staphylococcus delphini]|uniref:restriction endonuclease subunit S n=1 Tax=Staphylococcus delphini TaxID=53344 RepID=UPI0021CF27A9|nr:restriction endonuclease subunit S [Staphylococcus delphini]UXS21557.1 restriction endonuclease subunit S [Staphylococcus delphini]UXS57503.1 restriction endonuclease subunit S [Staphylococcus delphini]